MVFTDLYRIWIDLECLYLTFHLVNHGVKVVLILFRVLIGPLAHNLPYHAHVITLKAVFFSRELSPLVLLIEE